MFLIKSLHNPFFNVNFYEGADGTDSGVGADTGGTDGSGGGGDNDSQSDMGMGIGVGFGEDDSGFGFGDMGGSTGSGGQGGTDTRDAEEQMADPARSAMEQSVNQAMASEMESQMAAAGMSSDEIGRAMMGFTGLSPAEQSAMLGAVQSQAAAHSLSQRSYLAQIQAFATQVSVAGLRSASVNARGFGLSVAADVLGLAMSNTLGPAIGAVANVSTVAAAIGLNFAVEAVVNKTVEAVMNAANTQAMRGITGLSNNASTTDLGNTEGAAEGEVLKLGLYYEAAIAKYGASDVADGIDIALTLLYGQVYRSRSNIIGSAFDPLRGLLLLR